MEKLILAILFAAITMSMAHDLNQLTYLHESLFRDYYNIAKPSEKTTVKVGLELIDLNICPESQTLRTSVWLQMSWNDSRLIWNPEEYGNITEIRVNPSRIWMPDLTLYFAAAATESIYLPGEDHSNIILNSGGNLIQVPSMIYTSHCNVNYTNWPWGVQNCSLSLGSWTYSMKDMDVDFKIKGNEKGLDNKYFKNNQVEILEMLTQKEEKKYACCKELYPNLRFDIIFKKTAMFQDGKLIQSPTGI